MRGQCEAIVPVKNRGSYRCPMRATRYLGKGAEKRHLCPDHYRVAKQAQDAR